MRFKKLLLYGGLFCFVGMQSNLNAANALRLFAAREARTLTVGAGLAVRAFAATPCWADPLKLQHIKGRHSKADGGEFAVATTDISFKHLLDPAQDSEVIVSFLNTFVPAFAHDPVKEVHSAPVVIPALPRDKERKEKATFMDLHVRAESGVSYIVEMQARRHILFDERALFYLCNTYGRQLSQAELRSKDWYRALKPTIGVQVLDYDSNRIRGVNDDEIEDDQVRRVKEHPLRDGDYTKHYRMTGGHSGQELDHIQMVQVALPRYITRPLFPPQKDFGPLEWGLSILRHSSKYSRDYLKELEAKKIIMPDIVKKAFDRLSYEKWNPDMQKEYRLQVEDREEFETMYAVERAEGHEEGKETKAIEVAERMLLRGRAIEEVSEDTGLSKEKVAALAKERGIEIGEWEARR